MQPISLPTDLDGQPSWRRGMNILVTGGCGFIGRHLVKRLLNDGHRLIVYDNLSTGTLDNIPYNHDRLTLVRGDTLNADSLAANLRGPIDAVFHLASVVGMQQVHNHYSLTYDTSVIGTRNVLAATGTAPVVMFSSSAVYGLMCGNIVSESQPINDAMPLAYDGGKRGYACGKRDMELIGLDAADSGRKIMIIRPFNVIGTYQSPSYGMVLPRFIDQAFRTGVLSVYDDGLQTRCFTEVGTFINTLMSLVNKPLAWKTGKNIVNVGNCRPVSILDLAKIVIEESGIDGGIEHLPYNRVFPGKEDVRQRAPDSALLHSLVGSVVWPDIRNVVRMVIESRKSKDKIADKSERHELTN